MSYKEVLVCDHCNAPMSEKNAIGTGRGILYKAPWVRLEGVLQVESDEYMAKTISGKDYHLMCLLSEMNVTLTASDGTIIKPF